MKITITKEELFDIMSAHFEKNVTKVTITRGSTLHIKLRKSLANDLMLPQQFDQRSLTAEKKIPAIKFLRTHFKSNEFGLGDAKWAIENWDRWIKYVEEHGRIPLITNYFSPSSPLT